MSTNDVVSVMSNIPIGTVIAWGTAVIGITGAVSAFTVKMYKIFDKYKSIKDENAALKTAVANNTAEIVKTNNKVDVQTGMIIKQLQEINEKLEAQRESKIKELRHTLVSVGEEALDKKWMSIRAWESLHEMYNDYRYGYNQNTFVQSMMERIEREVKVVGKLDEHGYDIE